MTFEGVSSAAEHGRARRDETSGVEERLFPEG
jgi:hypothetical protein